MSVIEITKENFDAEVLENPAPVVLDFWGPSCGPCLAIAPKFHELAESQKYSGRIKFCSVDTSKNKRVAVNMRVMSLPTFLFFKAGKEVARLNGNNATIEKITSKLDELQ